MIKQKISSKNSGTVRFYLQSTASNSYGAKVNVKSLADMRFVKSKFYSVENTRQEDILFAESISAFLSMKIKTHLDKDIETKHKAVVDNTLFDIINVDHDYKNRDTYIYLQEVGKVEG